MGQLRYPRHEASAAGRRRVVRTKEETMNKINEQKKKKKKKNERERLTIIFQITIKKDMPFLALTKLREMSVSSVLFPFPFLYTVWSLTGPGIGVHAGNMRKA